MRDSSLKMRESVLNISIVLCLAMVSAVLTAFKLVDSQDQQESFPSSPCPVSDVFFLDSSHGWVLQARLSARVLLRTTDGGRTWASSKVDTGLYKVDFVDPNFGWGLSVTLGPGNLTAISLMQTKDSGSHWEKISNLFTSTASDQGVINEILFVDRLRGWLLGERTAGRPLLLNTVDGGRTTRDVARVLPSGARIASIFSGGNKRLWLFGTNTILFSDDDGLSWQNQLRQNPGDLSQKEVALRDGWVFENGKGWAVGQGMGGVLLGTDNLGVTWKVDRELPQANFFVRLFFWDQRHGCAVGASTILYCTIDGGESWTARSVLPPAKRQVGFLSNVYVKLYMSVEGEGWALDEGGFLYHTTDAGQSWSPFDPLSDGAH